MPRLLSLAAVLGVLCAAAATTPARAPTVDEAPSRAALLARLEKERVFDQNKPPEKWQVQIDEYRKGVTPIGEWMDVAAIVKDKDAPQSRRNEAAEALKARMTAEGAKATDPRLVGKTRADIARDLLDLWKREDPPGHQCLTNLLNTFFPNAGIEFPPSGDARKRARAHQEWTKRLKDDGSR